MDNVNKDLLVLITLQKKWKEKRKNLNWAIENEIRIDVAIV